MLCWSNALCSKFSATRDGHLLDNADHSSILVITNIFINRVNWHESRAVMMNYWLLLFASVRSFLAANRSLRCHTSRRCGRGCSRHRNNGTPAVVTEGKEIAERFVFWPRMHLGSRSVSATAVGGRPTTVRGRSEGGDRPGWTTFYCLSHPSWS